MRNFVEFVDTCAFYDRALGLLMEHEAENCLLIGIAAKLAESISIDWADAPAAPLMCGVEDEGRMTAAAIMAPPHRLIVTRLGTAAALLIAENLHWKQVGLPGVLGQADACASFAEAWSQITGRQSRLTRRMRVYQIEEVVPPPRVSGRFQAAAMHDAELVVRWTGEFWKEVGEHVHAQPQTMRKRITDRQVFLWLDPLPVSMATFAGPTPNGIRVGVVYTPPEHRRTGYATALTAATSQYLLDKGYRYCYLFTDRTNQTSNHIYASIGYHPVCDYDQYDFSRGAWAAVA